MWFFKAVALDLDGTLGLAGWQWVFLVTGVPAVLLGYSGGASLVVKGLLSLPLSDIKAAHEAWLPGYMAATE